jgi:hypothetical protein
MNYQFVVNATITLGVEVEADSLEEAVEKAKDANVLDLCHACSAGKEGQWNTSGELDCGAPEDLDLVDFHTDDEDVCFEDACDLWIG